MSVEGCSGGDEGPKLNVGVMCIQGAFIEHVSALERLARESKGEWQLNIVDVRKPSQLDGLDGLIIPGGESTTLSVFLSKNNFESALRRWLSGDPSHSSVEGVPGDHTHQPHPPGVLWGTCAGLILIANTLTEQKRGGQVTVGGLDVECSRNIYGRQISSFESPITLHPDFLSSSTSCSSNTTCHGIFIRAPGISRVTSPEVKILGTLEPEGTVVAVQQRNLIATTFHPELTTDTRWHRHFIHEIIKHKREWIPKS